MTEVIYRRPNRTAYIELKRLVSMLNEWTKQFIVGARTGLGYPMQDPCLTFVKGNHRSTDGVGFSEYGSDDFDAVDEGP